MNSTTTFSCTPRHNWTSKEIEAIYTLPFPELIFQAATIHRKNFDYLAVQRSTLLSIKTGGCPENCKYCPQSAHHDTGLEREPLMNPQEVIAKAQEAKDEGSTRFCMGAAWRQIKDGKEFDQVLETVHGVKSLGLEVCCTLGMLTIDQAKRLKEAGCYAYNHNLDTSPEHYGEIISTRTYQERLDTLSNVRKAGMTVCCGGIVGMGEDVEDRFNLLKQLANQSPHPESVPLNVLVKVEGTPLQFMEDIDPIEFLRLVATTRIVMPQSMVRLSAGRKDMSEEMQALAFFAGANSIFAGDKLLTTPNPGEEKDVALITKLGMKFFDGKKHSEKAHCTSCGSEETAQSCI